MNEKTIKKLIKLVEESDIDVLEVSHWGQKVRITRRLTGAESGNGSGQAYHQVAAPSRAATAPAATEAPPAPVATAAASDEDRYVAIKAPMVGTFYAAPAPDAKPYVQVGQNIEKGQVVCIVEAMKLMNEIEADVAGRIAKVCIENSQPVEFGQPLFFIDPSG